METIRSNEEGNSQHFPISILLSRSELLIQNTSLEDNGTYHCEARNKAARAVSNFTLHVTSVVDSPEILKVYRTVHHS